MPSRKIKRLKSIEAKKKRPWVLFTISGILIILFVLYGGYRALRSLFVVEKIIIIGNKVLSDEELKTLIGVKEGRSLLEVSSSQIYHRLIASPWIKDAVIRKGLPDRLIIWIEESSPQALIKKNGRLYLIDETGSLLEEVKEGSGVVLPVLEIDYENKDLLIESLSLLKALKEMNITVEEGDIFIRGSRKEDLAIVLKKGQNELTIRVGAGDYHEKFSRLLEFTPSIREKGLRPSIIDLRFRNRVIVQPLTSLLLSQSTRLFLSPEG